MVKLVKLDYRLRLYTDRQPTDKLQTPLEKYTSVDLNTSYNIEVVVGLDNIYKPIPCT